MVSAVNIHIQTPAPPSGNGNVWVWENGLDQKKFPFKARINGRPHPGFPEMSLIIAELRSFGFSNN